eukprot:UN02354
MTVDEAAEANAKDEDGDTIAGLDKTYFYYSLCCHTYLWSVGLLYILFLFWKTPNLNIVFVVKMKKLYYMMYL